MTEKNSNEIITLQNVLLKNFKCHRELDVDFAPTLTTIVGPNYSGKTTIMQAVFYALFGVSTLPGDRESVTTRGEKSHCVTLKVLWGTKVVKITRTASTAVLDVDDERMATGATSVTGFCETLFGGMSGKLVLKLARSARGEVSNLLEEGAPKLNRLLEEVNDTDYVDQLIERSGKLATKHKIIAESITVSDTSAELMDTIYSRTRELEKQNASLTDLAAQKETTKLELTRLLAESLRLQTLKNQWENTVNYNDLTYARAATLSESLASERHNAQGKQLQDATEQAAVTNKLYYELKEAREVNYTAISKNSILAGKQHTVDTFKPLFDVQEANLASNAKYETELASVTIECRETSRLLSVAKSGKYAAQTAMQDYDKSGGKCPTCKRDYTHLEQLTSRLQEAEQELEVATANHSETSARYQAAELANKTLCRKVLNEGEVSYYKLALAYCETNQDLPIIDVEKLEKAYKAESDKLAQMRTENASYNESVDRINALQQRINSELEKLRPVPVEPDLDALKTAKAQVEKLVAFEVGLDTAIRETGRLIEVEQRACTAARTELATLQEALRKKDLSERKHLRFGEFQKWLRKNKEAFLATTWAMLLEDVSRFVSTVTDGAITEVTRNDKGVFCYAENGQVLEVDGSASGAQLSVMGVGLRVALSNLLPTPIGFLALDEPSAEMDEAHAAAMSLALKSLGRQIILASHDVSDEEMSESVISLS